MQSNGITLKVSKFDLYFNQHFLIGLDNICKLLKYCEDKKDCWLIYEVCQGKTMNEALFNVKGEFYKGERIYLVHHSMLYHCMRNNVGLMMDFVTRMGQVLNLFY